MAENEKPLEMKPAPEPAQEVYKPFAERERQEVQQAQEAIHRITIDTTGAMSTEEFAEWYSHATPEEREEYNRKMQEALNGARERAGKMAQRIVNNIADDETTAAIRAIKDSISETVKSLVSFVQSDEMRELMANFRDVSEWVQGIKAQFSPADILFMGDLAESAKEILPYINDELQAYMEENGLADMPIAEFMQNTDPETGEAKQSIYSIVIQRAEQRAAADKAGKEKTPAKELPEAAALPNGEAISLLFKILAGNVGSYGLKPNPKNNREEIKAGRDSNGTLKITRSIAGKNKSKIEVSIAQVDKYFRGKNTAFSKTFAFTLQQMSIQSFPLEVGFSLEEMVKLKMYQSTDAARRAFKTFFDQQKQITLSGTSRKGRKVIAEQGGILFYNYRISNNYVTLSVNPNFNMEFLAAYFTVFPTFAYSLNANAFNLCRYIFSLARQHGAAIGEKGYFTVSLDSIRDVLGLPAPEECANRKYKQYIYDPIEKAIEDIEDAARNSPLTNNQQFTITPMGTDTTRPNEWLKGYLIIGMSGSIAESTVDIAKKKMAHKEAAKKELAKQEAKQLLKSAAESKPE